jgi:hypothetical protein
MIDWLERGPWDPPPEVVDSAVAYARSHPRRALRFAGLWRRVMSGIRLAPVQQRPASSRSLFIALATVAAAVVVTIGLIGGFNLLGPEGQAGAATSSASPSNWVPPSDPPSPVRITGRMFNCETTATPEIRVVGHIIQTRGQSVRCTLFSSDERLDGKATLVYNSDRVVSHVVDLGNPDVGEPGASDAWGTAKLELGDGRWAGVWRGTVEWQGYVKAYKLAGVFLGAGDYGGLRVRWTLDAPAGGNVSADLLETSFELAGTLETIDTIPPDGTTLISGSTSCSDTDPGAQTVVGEITQFRGVIITCSGNVGSDPRLEGTGRTVLNGDQMADDSATLWGTEEIIIDGAVTWRGDYSATVAPGFTTHRMSGTDVGYGSYAGLVYEWTMIGDPSSGYVNSGTIHPAP